MCVVTKIQLNERIQYFYGLFGNMFLRKHMIDFLTLTKRSAELTLKHKLMKLKPEMFEKPLQETTDDGRTRQTFVWWIVLESEPAKGNMDVK